MFVTKSRVNGSLFSFMLAQTFSNGFKSPIYPDSGKHTILFGNLVVDIFFSVFI